MPITEINPLMLLTAVSDIQASGRRETGQRGVMTAHGFRSTANSLLNECGKWQADAIERVAHVETNAVKVAYSRTTYWAERVAMHRWWWSDELGALRDAAN